MQLPPPPDASPLIDEPSFRRHVAQRLALEPVDAIARRADEIVPPSDFDLNPGLETELRSRATEQRASRAAAVLVPVVARRPLTVLFTLRTDHLPSHAGQVSFPGGKIDDADADAITTALREAEEEIHLPRTLVEPLGFLDTYRTSTGYHVAPLVALVSPDHRAHPNPEEVAAIFEVPLAYLMDKANIALHRREWLGRERQFYAYDFESRYIWGATAGMLNNMRERLFPE